MSTRRAARWGPPRRRPLDLFALDDLDPAELCGPTRTTRMYVNELIGFDAAEADREILCWKIGARRLRSVDGGGEAPAGPTLPPSLELVAGPAAVPPAPGDDRRHARPDQPEGQR